MKGAINDPYIKKVLQLAGDKSLFSKTPGELKKLRRDLLRDSLGYFIRHNQKYYKPLLRNLGIIPEKAELKDLVRLAIPSDLLRENYCKKMSIREMLRNSEVFRSSGTTANERITVYKSPIDEQVNNIAIPNYVSNHVGFELNGGLVLMLASPKNLKSIALFGNPDKYYKARGFQVIYGIKCPDKTGTLSKELKTMKLNKKAINKFIKSKIEPKVIFSAPAGIQQLLEYLSANSIQINLGKNGYINTGGGTKANPALTLKKLRQKRKNLIFAFDRKGKKIPAPWYDGIGHTEGIMILLSGKNSDKRVPHPLEEVFLVNRNGKLIREGTGMAGHWNPLNATYFEAFYPGDVYQVKKNRNYYGKSFSYKRRLVLGDVLRPGCGASIDIRQDGELTKETKHAGKLVKTNKLLANADLIQRRLIQIPLELKLEAIQAVSELWKNKNFKRRKGLAALLAGTSGYSKETIDFELNDIPAYLDSVSLKEVFDVSFKKGEQLFPKGPILVIGSGNTLAPALYSWAYAILTNNVIIIRSSQANYHGLKAILDSLTDALKKAKSKKTKKVLALMKKASAVINVSHKSQEYAMLIEKGKFNLIHFWGGKKALEFLKKHSVRNPHKPSLMVNGPETGIAVIDGKCMRANKTVDKIAEELAFNMAIFEQKLCSSPTEAYFIGSYGKALKFAQAIAKKMPIYNKRFPHNPGDLAYKTQLARNLIGRESNSIMMVTKSREADYTIVLSNKSSVTDKVGRQTFKLHAQSRVKYLELIVVDNLMEAVENAETLPNRICYEGIEGLNTIGYHMKPQDAKIFMGLAHRIVPIEGIFGRSSHEPSDGRYIAREYTTLKKRKSLVLRKGEHVKWIKGRLCYFAEPGVPKRVAFFNLVRGRWKLKNN